MKKKLTFKQKRFIVNFKKEILEKWLIYSTIIIILTSLLVLLFLTGPTSANEAGDFIAGFAGALAFLWLIASFRMQSQELSIQRNEIKLQRHALLQQNEEFKRLAKFSALEHVKSMTEKMISNLESTPKTGDKKEPYKHPQQLLNSIFPYYIGSSLRDLVSSEDESEVRDDYKKYRVLKESINDFIRSYIAASKFMIESTDGYIIEDLNDLKFIKHYKTRLINTPYLSPYADLVAELISIEDEYLELDKLYKITGSLVSSGLLSRASGLSEAIVEDIMDRQKNNKTVPKYLLKYCEDHI